MYHKEDNKMNNKMNKKITTILTILMLLLTLTTTISINKSIETKNTIIQNIQMKQPKNIPLSTNDEIIYVDDDNTMGPWEGTIQKPYQHITDAIENTTHQNTIYVYNGTYNENFTIDKTLTLTGENKENTIIDGEYAKTIINVIENQVTIKNFTIRNSGGYGENAGIRLNSEGNHITKCIIQRTKTGIYINKTNNNQIDNCTLHTNGIGICLKSTYNISIIQSCFCHNAIGIQTENANMIKINGGYFHTNGIGLYYNHSSNIETTKCAVYNNNDNQGGYVIINSNNIDIYNCNINHNGFGISIKKSSSINIIQSDLFWNTHIAILIGDKSQDINIENCEISENFRFSIYAEKSKCKIQNNNIHNSTFGIYTENSLFNARRNWWGSPFGPALADRKIKDRIFSKLRWIKFFPWRIKKSENTGSNWDIDNNLYPEKINTSRFKTIEIIGIDSDNDHTTDSWEEKYGYNPLVWDDHENLDPDNDGLTNVEECYTDQWDSHPFKKDIFLEYDWIETENSETISNKPPRHLISKMIESFANHNIVLHVDDGSMGGGEEISYMPRFTYPDLVDLYWDYFLHNDLNNPRKGIFHYGLICDYGPNYGFAFMGWDHLDSFELAAETLQGSYPYYSRGMLIVGASFHELGHSLGLFADDHGGNDNRISVVPLILQWWKYRNYKSCMNYQYTYKILDFSDGTNGKGDFNDWANIDLTFFKNTHFNWPQ